MKYVNVRWNPVTQQGFCTKCGRASDQANVDAAFEELDPYECHVPSVEARVTFRWRDSAHGNQKRLMTLPVVEFLRRFLLHLLPRGFVRIRNFGFLANGQRVRLLPLCFRLLQDTAEISAATASPVADHSHSLWNCPVCGGTMHLIERLSAAQLLLRSPPRHEYAA